MDVYRYDDGKHFTLTKPLRSAIRSNLCSMYFVKKKRFCGNYCTRYKFGVDRYHGRCWRHIKKRSGYLPPIVLLMIISDRIHNKSRWLHFIEECDRNNVPIELVVYEKNMFKCTVRHAWNFISRFRPIPELYHAVQRVHGLHDSHGQMNYATVYTDMLAYGSSIPHALCCIVITERTIPIRTAIEIYRSAIMIAPKCAVDPSYNVSFDVHCPPSSLPTLARGKQFTLVNNKAQGLFSVAFLKESLPTLRKYCEYFGLQYSHEKGYTVKDRRLYEQWQRLSLIHI